MTKRARDPEISRRIGEAIDASGENAHSVSREMRVAYSTVFNWTTGVSEPSATLLRDFVKATASSADWILTGESPRTALVPAYPSREKFLGSNHGLEPGDRMFLASLDFGPEDPGSEAWSMLLGVRRQLRRQRQATATKLRGEKD